MATTPASSYTITAGVLQAYPSSSNPFIAAGPDTYTFLRYDTFNAMVASGAITTSVTVVPASGSLPAGYTPAAAWSSQPSVAAFKALDSTNNYIRDIVNIFLAKQFATFDAPTGIITFRNTPATVSGGGSSGSVSNQPLFLGAAKVTGINWDFRNSVIKGLIETTEATAPIPLSQLNKSVTDLQTKIDAITSKDSDLQSQITDEVTRAKGAEDDINSTLTGYASSFSTDIIVSKSGGGIQLNGGQVVFENGFQAGDATVYYFTSNVASCGRLTSHSDQTSIEVQTSFAMSNNSITDILDAVNPQDVPAYHQLIDAVEVEKARAEAKEKSLTDSISAFATQVSTEKLVMPLINVEDATGVSIKTDELGNLNFNVGSGIAGVVITGGANELNSQTIGCETLYSASYSSAVKLGNDIQCGTNHILNIGDALTDNDVPSFGQVKSWVATASTAVLQAEIDTLKSQIDTLNASVTALNLFSKAMNKVMFHNDNLTPPV